MKSTGAGSTLLIVFFIMTALLIAGAALWHSTSLMVQIGHMRQQHVQQEYLTEGLLQYGVACCKEQINYLIEQARSGKKSHTFSLQKWPPSTGMHTGIITCEMTEKYCMLRAQLLEKQVMCCAAQCRVYFKLNGKKKLTSLYIDGWTLNAA